MKQATLVVLFQIHVMSLISPPLDFDPSERIIRMTGNLCCPDSAWKAAVSTMTDCVYQKNFLEPAEGVMEYLDCS